MALSPMVAKWELAHLFRERRQAMGLTAKQVSAALGFSPNHWSTIETAKVVLARDKLDPLITLLQFDDTTAERVRALREEARKTGWWDSYADLLPLELLSFYGMESGAASIRSYEASLITGLLQTEEYARALTLTHAEVNAPDARRFVEIRRKRQERLSDDDDLRLTVIQGEASLLQQVGGRKVLLHQLRHLLESINRLEDRLELRIYPFGSEASGIQAASTLHLLEFPGSLPPMVWRESVTPIGLSDDPKLVNIVDASFEQGLQWYLSPDDSLAMIEDRIRCLES